MSSNGSLGGGEFRKKEKVDRLGAGRLGIAKSKAACDGKKLEGLLLVRGSEGGWTSVIRS